MRASSLWRCIPAPSTLISQHLPGHRLRDGAVFTPSFIIQGLTVPLASEQRLVGRRGRAQHHGPPYSGSRGPSSTPVPRATHTAVRPGGNLAIATPDCPGTLLVRLGASSGGPGCRAQAEALRRVSRSPEDRTLSPPPATTAPRPSARRPGASSRTCARAVRSWVRPAGVGTGRAEAGLLRYLGEEPEPSLPKERSMSATRAKKVKMATKSCPECDQQEI
ncbi:uncharacterized protein LOC144370975 [Ictidomys tridecemlineatus]